MEEIVTHLRSRVSTPIRVETDPARHRPHDTPLVVGDHAALTRDTGWEPAVSFTHMLDDLLDWWRGAVATTAA